MRESLKYPSFSAAESVLTKIGVDPSTRFDKFDQDFEYTSCEVGELDKYLDLYVSPETTDEEKRLLGCFILQCLNDYIEEYDKEHEKQSYSVELLFNDMDIHETELEYWSTTHSDDENDWWYITKYLIDKKNITKP